MTVCIVSHDAGGAEILASYVAQMNVDCRMVLEGPAVDVFKRQLGSVEISTLPDSLLSCDWCLCGTGWQSDLEWRAIALAQEAGKRAVAFLDHWVSYRERFIRGGVEHLPNEIWVVDEHAKKLAEEIFTGLKIKQLPNNYLDRQVAEIRQFEKNDGKGHRTNILYVLEPIRQKWGNGDASGEFQALEFFVENMATLGFGNEASIRLKPHPSDPAGKYDSWMRSQAHHRISMDTHSSLAELIGWSDVVVGCQTYAMVVALAAGRRVISSIPPWGPDCALPQPGIIKLSDLLPL